jgi:hypothetical protein
MPTRLSASSRSLRPSVSIVFPPHVPYSYAFASEKLGLHSLRTRSYHFDAFFFVQSIVALNPALPSWKMLVFVFLLAVLGTYQRLVFVPLINSVQCAYAANPVGKDLDIFAIGAVSLNYIYSHQPKIVNTFS